MAYRGAGGETGRAEGGDLVTGEVMRAADTDRERVAAALREEMAVGRLTMEEFDDRLSRAYEAKTWDELRVLTSDLPVDITFDGEAAPKAAAPRGSLPGSAPGEAHAHRFPWFAPFLIIPLIGMGIAVAHGAFGALVPMAIIVWMIVVRRPRRRVHYRARYRMR